jgi:hypothetical protein
VADESGVVMRARTTQPCRSEGALLRLTSFNGGKAGKNDKGFHKSAGTEVEDIQEGEGRLRLEAVE